MSPKEIATLEKLKDGDLASFNEIYFQYSPKIYVRLIKLVKDQVVAEEILQDVFTKVWVNRAKIDATKGFVSFLNHISDNLAIDFFRKVQRDKSLQLELWVSAVELYYHTEEHIHLKDTQDILAKAIDSLSPKRKEILILNKFQEKSYKEIAEELGISVSTVSNQLVSALKDIKEYIQKNYRNEAIISFLATLLFKL
ncbi:MULTISPECIES: RNA polymerase sigma factor [Sphingobacterium]|uniref:RNA polymerase sigma factor n=1 Tax=Sphingobacterium TaxID=28453 RepID=UPI0010521E4F|nr:MULTISPECIES: RNA polymerase sigma-70 factor [Sphingobacterium]MCW2260050.1 RNA polymerase sigma-70 factor (ECF subfamily) [Sphingobacterium kitahiroshimense]TCR11158.1 RNA polymerase sigma-70 factor (ECF subfamily) [Sphingobacterium sp. JUb78]